MRIVLKIAAASSLMAILAGCGAGLTAFNKGEKLEREGKLDEAILKYTEALADDPDAYEYRIRLIKAREKGAMDHLESGERAMAARNFDEALREYQAAMALDPSLERAKQRVDQLIRVKNAALLLSEGQEFEKTNKPREALQAYRKSLDLNPESKETKEALERLLATRKTRLEGYDLNLKSTKPITLKFKDAKLKDVFYIITQLSGINFIFDEGVKDQNVTIFLENATFQQALDVLTNMNKLGRKVLNESTIVVFPKTPEKSKQYEDLIVKTFYLNTLDAKKAVNLLRTMLQVRKVYVNEELNSIVIRDTPDLVDVAGKIIEANDVSEAEVLLDVEILEVSWNNKEQFGLFLSPYSVSLNGVSPSGQLLSTSLSPVAAPATGTTQAGPGNLLEFLRWKGFSGVMTVPNASFDFIKNLTKSQTLANPKIRVKNKEKAKFISGQRIPITTTSSTGTTGGFSVNVQYIDVGVKLNAEPTILLDNEVNIKLGLEVSNAGAPRQVGPTDAATTVVDITNRNVDTVLLLKDGETAVIGGLIQDSNGNVKDKPFFLGDIPIIGPILTRTANTRQKNEIVLAITPRIVRAVSVPEPDVASFWSGKEDDPSVVKPFASFEQEPEFGAPAPAGQPKGAPAPGAVQPPAARAPIQPAPPAAPQPTAVPGAPAPAVTALVQPAPEPPMRGSLNIAAPASVDLGSQFKVEIKVSDAKGLAKAPFILLYDPIFIDYVGAAEGNFLNRDGKPTSFNALADKNAGRVTVNLGRVGEVEGIDGSGTLLTATFTAKNKGPASLGLQNVRFVDQANRPLDIIPYNTVVEVK